MIFVKEISVSYVTCITKCDTLHLQKSSFHFQTTLKATQGSIGTDRPVAGDNKGERIGRQGCSNGAGTVRIFYVFRNEVVRADSTAGNSVLGTQNFLLKGRAKVEANHIERELNILAIQECLDLINDDVDLWTGRSNGIGEELPDGAFGRGSRLG